MKSEAMGVGTPVISKKDLKELLHETKESLAVDVKNDNSRTFSHLDLWNVQKRQKTGTSMRRRLM